LYKLQKSLNSLDSKKKMPSTGGVILFGLLALGMVGVIIGTTVNTRADPVPLPVMRFQEGTPDNHFQQHVCACKNDWPLAIHERERSNEVFAQVGSNAPDPRGLSSLAAFFGQFIDHDIVLSESDSAQGLFQLQMTPYDAVLNLTRNSFRLENSCRATTNKNTPAIDATTVYGDYFNPDMPAQLRDGASCKLHTSAGNLLPKNYNNEFIAGDVRNTEHSILAAMHTLWMREHNRLCDEMPAHFTEDQKFWKARQVVVAKIQRITYEEWLPALFGSQAYLLNSVPIRGDGLRLSLEFGTVAYRFGHSMIPDPIGPFALPSLFFNAQLLIDNGIDAFLSAAYTTRAQQVDTKVIDGLRDFLFAAGPNVIGEDLIARNLFRVHDVGLGTYAQIARCYGLEPIVEDEEGPFIGLLSESLVAGSSLPRTIAHIVAEQFRRLRMYDPRHYTKIAGDIGSHFYQQVQSATMASVIRANTDLQSVPDKVFFI